MLDTPSIKILDNLVVDQIAAGEVVERPSAIVKELVENAIDANASEIYVEVVNGGIDSIVVIDNGKGMNKVDLSLCVERFGTSKISFASDLENISSYGFRGEALPSIASVSKFSILSREIGAKSGNFIEVIGGHREEIIPMDAKEGTKIQVKDLFFNVPARRKFLKSARSEANYIRAVLADFSYARPDIHFFYYEDGKEIQIFPGKQNLLDRIKQTKIIQGQPIEVKYEKTTKSGSRISIEGFVAEPIFASRGGTKIRILVNGRLVKSALLVRALKDAYGSFLRPGYYPSGVIKLFISPSAVDVNVHPQKTEVRFREEGEVFVALKEAVEGAIRKVGNSSNVAERSYLLRDKEEESRGHFIEQVAHKRAKEEEVVFSGQGSLFENSASYEIKSLSREQGARYVGQIFSLYLLFEEGEKFHVLDMHAAHERVTFYNMKKAFLEGSIKEQLLLVPEIIPLSSYDYTGKLFENLDALRRFGLELEVRGEQLVIRSIPGFLNISKSKEIVNNLLEFLPDKSIESFLEEKSDAVITLMACHGSLRRGKIISSEDAYCLLEQVREVDLGAWCPHGRPVIWTLSEDDLEKKFGRIQP